MFSRFSSLLSFGKCAHSVSKKVLSVLFSVLCFFSCLSISAFAADEGLDVNNFGYTASYVAPGASTSTNITGDITKQIPSSGDVVRFDFPLLNTTPGVAASTYMTLNLFDGFVIRPDHEYTMSFMFGNRMQTRSKLDVFVIIYNSNGTQYGSKVVYSFDGICSNSSQTADFNFKLKSSELPDGYRTSLKLVYQSFWTNTSNAVPERFYISRYISVVDNDDNSGLLKEIISSIKAIPSNISSFFSTLGDRIGQFFADVKQRMIDTYNGIVYNLSQFKDGVKSWFKELGDRIQQFFVDLYNDIVEGLKSLFIPSDGYFESKKTELENFCLQHFGALYQAPDVILDFVNKFVNLTPKQPSITLPAIQFDFNGTRYVLSDAITYSFSWVNDSSHPLFYFYKFYRGFATLFLFFFFGDFCIKKYNEVFAGGDPD